MPLFPNVIQPLQRSLQAAGLRQRVIADNIANVNTPGFQAAEVSFEDRLSEAFSVAAQEMGLQGITLHEQHLPIGTRPMTADQIRPQVRPATTSVMRQDGNTVDIETEMANLAANQLWYQMLVRSISDEFTRLRTVIMEGRR